MGRPSTRESALKTIAQERVVIEGSFAPNGTGAVDSASVYGKGVTSVARSGTGSFTVTLSDTWAALESGFATCQFASATLVGAQLGAVDLSAKTLVINTINTTSGAAIDISANAANRINFMFVMRGTNVTR